MAVAHPTFTGFRPEAIQFLVDLAANNERAWFQPRKAEYERLLKEPLEALIAALAERFEARGIPLRADPAKLAVPDLPRRPLLEGQVAVQDEHRRELPVGRRRRSRRRRRPPDPTPRRSTRAAATSTSSRARSTSAAGSGTPTSPGSTPSGGGSRTTPRSSTRSSTNAAFKKTFGTSAATATRSSASRPAIPPTTPRPTS